MLGFHGAPRPGDVLDGRFRIDGLLGQGGFGAVYEAVQLNLQRKVALKMLRPDLIATNDARMRFRREAEMAQRLEHPNTVRLFDFGGEEAGMPYMAFELLNGRALDQIISRDGPQAEPRVARMASQVLKSLMEAHGKGIIHRDIKPSNIFLCDFPGEPDFAKVLDFGIAKSTQSTGVTSDGQVLGSPSYMSPEQVRGDAVDRRSDLYSLGLAMAEMLSGKLVYSGPSAVQVLMAQASEQPVPLPSAVTTSPLGPVIMQATEKRCEQRFSSAEEMLLALESALSTASDHPAAYGATLRLGTSPVADSVPHASAPVNPLPPIQNEEPAHRTAQAATHPNPTTISAATIESPSLQSTTIPISKPKLGGVIAAAVVGTAVVAGLAGGLGVWFVEMASSPSNTASSTSAGRINLSEANPFHRGNAFGSIDAAKIRTRAEQAGWNVSTPPKTNLEGTFTTVNLVLTRGEETALITLFVADDERIASALETTSRENADAVTRRDGSGVVVVTVKGYRSSAEELMHVIVTE